MHGRLPQALQLLPSYELWRNAGSLAAAPPMPAVANKLPSFHPGGNAGTWDQAGAAPTLRRAQLLRPSDLPPVEEFATADAAGQHSLANRLAAQMPTRAPPSLQSAGAKSGGAVPLLPQCSDVHHLAGEQSSLYSAHSLCHMAGRECQFELSTATTDLWLEDGQCLQNCWVRRGVTLPVNGC